MLGNIRNHASNPVIKGLLAVVIFVFIFFFGWSMTSQTTSSAGSVGEVNGDPVTIEEFQSAYSNMVELYSRIMGRGLDQEQAKKMGLPRKAFDQLVDQKLLLQEADRQKLKVTDEELAAAIQRQPAFMEGQVFSKAKYVQLLQNAGLTAERYEEMKRQELLIGKVQDSAKATVQVSEEELAAEYKSRKSTAAVDYVTFDPASYKDKVLVTDSRLKDFHAAQGEAFRKEERRSARFAFFPVDSFTSQINVTDEQAREEFKARAFNFVQPASVTARHILVKVSETADPATVAKAEAKVRALRDAVTRGQSFEAVAKASSEDEGTKESGGDLGTFGKGTMIPAFEQAAFGLKPGEVSQPVRTQFGFHLIKVAAKTEEKQRTFEEAKSDVIALIKREKARDLAYRAADNSLMDLEKKETDWTKLAQKAVVRSTALVTATQMDPTVPQVKGFMEALFELADGKTGVLLDSPTGTFLVSVADKRPAAIPSVGEIRSEVEAKFRIVEAKKLAAEAADRFAKEASAKGWAAAVSAAKLSSSTSETFSAKSGSILPLGASPDAAKAVFEKPVIGRVLEKGFEIEDKYYAFRISAIAQADMSGLVLDRERIRADLKPAKEEAAMEEMVKKLRDSASIKIPDESLFN